MNRDFLSQEYQSWFQDSPHKEHYDTFIHTDEGLHKLLNIILNNHSLYLPLPEEYILSQKNNFPEINSSKTTSKYYLQVEFQVDKPIANFNPIKRNKQIWNSQYTEGKNIIESLQGYLHIKVPVSINISFQTDTEDNKNTLKSKQIILKFRKIPLLDNGSIFWWGKPGYEIQRIPIGLIRYTPGPLLDKFWHKEKNTFIPRLLIRGEFDSPLVIELHRGSLLTQETTGLSPIEGSLFYNNKELSIQEVLDALDENIKEIISKILKIKYSESKTKQASQHNRFSKFQPHNNTIWPPLYLSELGRRRLERKLKILLGDDYHFFNDIKMQNSPFLEMRDIAMSIVGLVKNYSQIDNFVDDKLHLGNRRILLLHHIVSKSIYEGVRLSFNNPTSLTFKLPFDQLIDTIFNRVSELLELSTILSAKRLHNHIITSTQIADDINPLSLLSQRRKITFCGLGGIKTSFISKDINIRDIHPSYYGRICIVETNEGKGVGLNLQLAALARVRFNGEVETPYKMYENYIKWWSAVDEMIHEMETGKPLRIKFKDNCNEEDSLITHSNTMELETIAKSTQDYLPEDTSFIQPYGPATLLIPFLEHTDGTRAMMGAKNMKQALVLEKSEAPVIQTGFEEFIVRLDHINSTAKDRILSLGINALIAYMPWKGFNFEDGIVCSESFANKMITVHQKEITCEIFYGDKLIYQFDSPVLKSTGSVINYNDIIFRVWRNYKGNQYREEIRSEFSGILQSIEKISLMHPSVARFRKEPFDIFKAIIIQKKPLKVGDKIMGRHGNKGIISLILPDDEMPKLPDGTPIEVILNPNGVISRMNLSQILETHWGWIAYNKRNSKNKTFIFHPFQGPTEKDLQNELVKIPDTDSTGKVTLSYQVDEKMVKKPVVVGLQYILKLNHLAENKLKIRTTGKYNQLSGGAIRGKGGGQRIGEMEFWALRSFGANAIISETYKSKNLNDKETGIPRSSVSLDSILKAMGLVSDSDLDTVSYRLAKAEEISSWGTLIETSDIRDPKATTILSCKLCQRPIIIESCSNCNEEIILSLNKEGFLEGKCCCHSKRLIPWKCECGCTFPIKHTHTVWKNKEGGLLDPKLFGTKDTERYLKQFGIIKLNIPVFNPLYKINIGRNEDKMIIRGNATYVSAMDNGKEILKKVDFDNLSAKLKPDDILTPVDALNKQFSEKLSSEKLQELTITNLPVIPLAFRDPESYSNDLHIAYHRILEINKNLETIKDPFQIKRYALLLQKAIHILFWGNGKHNNTGLISRIQGREGILRSAVLARRVDYSARAVITPFPELQINECILPQKMEILFDSKEYNNSSLDKRVLIHRAATLHKYNILSFKVKKFWDEDTVGLPPLVCSYMNADFDGDTVAVHLPLSDKANKEASCLLSPELYLFGYSDGSFMPHITQDIVLGIYLLAKSNEGKKMIADIFKLPLTDIKTPLIGNKLKKLCADFSRKNPNNISVRALFELSILGFKQATLSGASFSIFDVPAISLEERISLKSSNPDEWRQRVSDKIQTLSRTLAESETPNGVAWLIESGARGSKDQIVQLGGIRGSMYRPDGKRIDEPVVGNFREGLKSYEYWISAPGTRKGMIDKHINTQPAGILHRKLVESGYPLEIVEEDCNTPNGIFIRKEWNIPEGTFIGKAQNVPFSKRIIGRTLTEAILLNLNNNKIEIIEGKQIDYSLAKTIEENQNIKKIKVRSPLLCKANGGICSKCYGLSLDRLELQNIGTPIGLIAGHVIGERGVQLAMRTFHTGGASVSEVISSLPWIRKFLGAKEVKIPIYKIITNDRIEKINRWNLILSFLSSKVDTIEEIDEAELSINDFLQQLIPKDKGTQDIDYSKIYDNFLHVIGFEILSIYSGEIANIHFEVLFKAMLNADGTFNGIFSQASNQNAVLASASHDRAIQRIFNAAIENHKDIHIPWRESFIRGLI